MVIVLLRWQVLPLWHQRAPYQVSVEADRAALTNLVCLPNGALHTDQLGYRVIS